MGTSPLSVNYVRGRDKYLLNPRLNFWFTRSLKSSIFVLSPLGDHINFGDSMTLDSYAAKIPGTAAPCHLRSVETFLLYSAIG